MGSTALLVLGGLIFILGAVYAAATGALLFAVTVLALAAVGASTYVFLYVRAGLQPFINEADPSTWESLLAVIRREQYPPRSPLDNPIFPSGPDNPGRSISLLLLQIQNYLQYFDWQWANSLRTSQPVFAWPRLPFTLLFTSLGIYGLQVIRRRDRGMFWLLFLLWLTTGLGLMIYINFKPGYSIGYDLFPDPNHHEVRERDYFYTVSYQVWGLFAGAGIDLVDLKFEFGRTSGGEVILADEISPDTCRFRDIETGEILDKDLFRFDEGDLLAGYRKLLSRLAGALASSPDAGGHVPN